ncbi:hypothetical protein MRX96_030878 [Rhipicephalus microplus]
MTQLICLRTSPPLSEERKTRVPATDNEHKATDKVELTPDVPNTEHTPGHPEVTNTNAHDTRKEEYAVTGRWQKNQAKASAATLHDVTTAKAETDGDHHEKYHKISKRARTLSTITKKTV